MRKAIGILLSIITFYLVACSVKELEKYNEDFSGSWRSEVFNSPTQGDSARHYLDVDGKNSAFGYSCDAENPHDECLRYQSGKAKYNKANKGLQIGNSVEKIYRVDREPFMNDQGKWEMVLDSISYFKY